MSLLLRQAAQEILDESNLANYHVKLTTPQYQSSPLILAVVKECGEQLFAVPGIEFTRKNPSSKEIEYAVELLQAFLSTHKIVVASFLSLKGEIAEMGAFKLPEGYTGYNANDVLSEHAACNTSFKVGKVKYTIYSNGTLNMGMSDGTLEDINAGRIKAPRIKAANVVLENIMQHAKRLKTLQNDLETVTAELTACNI